MKRRIVLAVMTLVTAWSVWAVAQGHPGPTGPMGPRPGMRPAGAAPAMPTEAPRSATPPREGAESAESKAAESEREEAEEASKPPADINWVDFGRETPPYIALVINFGILAAGFYYFGKKPVAAALKNRRDTIAKDIDEAQRMRKEAEKRAKHYQAKLASLEQEVQSTRDTLLRAGEAEKERIVAEAEAKAERMRKDALFLVEQELKQLRLDLQRDTVETAIAAAEELLKKRVTQADQERLAEDYLADLGKPSNLTAAGGAS